MPTPERMLNLRGIMGINRVEDARMGSPGSWWSTTNLYGRSPGVLAKRPGTKLIVDGRTASVSEPKIDIPTRDISIDFPVDRIDPGEGSARFIPPAIIGGILGNLLQNGPPGQGGPFIPPLATTGITPQIGTRQMRPKVNLR